LLPLHQGLGFLQIYRCERSMEMVLRLRVCGELTPSECALPRRAAASDVQFVG
jgi:hypothetical protein